MFPWPRIPGTRFAHGMWAPKWMVIGGDVLAPDDLLIADFVKHEGLDIDHADGALADLSVMWGMARYCVGNECVRCHVEVRGSA